MPNFVRHSRRTAPKACGIVLAPIGSHRLLLRDWPSTDYSLHAGIMTNQNKRLPELPPLTIHGLPDEINRDRDPLDSVDRPIQSDKCPFCLNLINYGATACDDCGAYMTVSSMSNLRRLASGAWLILSLLFAWGTWDSLIRVAILCLITAALSIVGIAVKPRIVWIKH
jgi:hypothetical protein